MDLVCWLGLLHTSKMFTSLSLLVLGLFMIYHKFLFFITKAGLRYLCICSYTDMGCPVIEVSSF
jgi:hypothetical protein